MIVSHVAVCETGPKKAIRTISADLAATRSRNPMMNHGTSRCSGGLPFLGRSPAVTAGAASSLSSRSRRESSDSTSTTRTRTSFTSVPTCAAQPSREFAASCRELPAGSRSFLHPSSRMWAWLNSRLSCSSEFESSACSHAFSESQTVCRLGRNARNSGALARGVASPKTVRRRNSAVTELYSVAVVLRTAGYDPSLLFGT
jgi:hypothetical protein